MWAVWFSSMDQRLYIDLLELRFDDVRSASLFVRLFVIFDNFKHNRQKTVPFERRDDVQRFERQG